MIYKFILIIICLGFGQIDSQKWTDASLRYSMIMPELTRQPKWIKYTDSHSYFSMEYPEDWHYRPRFKPQDSFGTVDFVSSNPQSGLHDSHFPDLQPHYVVAIGELPYHISPDMSLVNWFKLYSCQISSIDEEIERTVISHGPDLVVFRSNDYQTALIHNGEIIWSLSANYRDGSLLYDYIFAHMVNSLSFERSPIRLRDIHGSRFKPVMFDKPCIIEKIIKNEEYTSLYRQGVNDVQIQD